jgi:hypothetical protein
MMLYFCCDKNRRDAVIASTLNGIDFIEVQDDPVLPDAQRQRTLLLHFVKPVNGVIGINNIVIHGGERIRNILVDAVIVGTEANILQIDVNKAGDFSVYTLCLVLSASDPTVPVGIDPQTASVDFSFKVECPSDFDCAPSRVCPPEIKAKPPINYLAKDYASFRRLMLDRMALTAPGWKSRNAADLGNTLVETLAYVGDHLSYQQDAVQTEGYFDLARHRVSVKRHARLVDYFMHDGCNARTWVQVQVNADDVLLSHEFMLSGKSMVTQFLTAVEKTETVIAPHSDAHQKALKQKTVVFEPIKLFEEKENETDADVEKINHLFSAHNEMSFYTWSDTLCCLPKGSTRATLAGHYPNLEPRDVLVFEEVMGPLTGAKEDANINHRHAVKIETVELITDPVEGQNITNISWYEEDTLPFALCISSRTDKNHGEVLLVDVSVALGNIILCDHGQSVIETLSPLVPVPLLYYHPVETQDRCAGEDPEAIPVRYRPALSQATLTHAATYDQATTSATHAMNWDVVEANPVIKLESELGADARHWRPVRDLMNSGQLENNFVAETNNDGRVSLRFGNDIQGRKPEPGSKFSAGYRIGNGVAGNIGADVIRHIVTLSNNITKVRNILPARGGMEMEGMQAVRRKAPFAFRTQERAVTEADYAEVTERQSGIQKAQATFRWTGSWHTVFITADRERGLAIDDKFSSDICASVEKYRMAGHDLNVDSPHFVPLEISMFVCVKPQHFRSDVKQALLTRFSAHDLPDGTRGVFHPDNFTFGETTYLSPLYETAQSVPGVESVQITQFQRLHQDNTEALKAGQLTMDRLEVAQLNNDPNFRERGIFKLTLGGGK